MAYQVASAAGFIPRVMDLRMHLPPSIPNDIESSRRCLKTQHAASIYGAQAPNGVVLITTKRGKQGQYQSKGFLHRKGWCSLLGFYDVG